MKGKNRRTNKKKGKKGKSAASAQCRDPSELSPLVQSLGDPSSSSSGVTQAHTQGCSAKAPDKAGDFLGCFVFTCNGCANPAFFSILRSAFRWCLQLNPASLYIYRHVCLLLVYNSNPPHRWVYSSSLFLWALPCPHSSLPKTSQLISPTITRQYSDRPTWGE